MHVPVPWMHLNMVHVVDFALNIVMKAEYSIKIWTIFCHFFTVNKSLQIYTREDSLSLWLDPQRYKSKPLWTNISLLLLIQSIFIQPTYSLWDSCIRLCKGLFTNISLKQTLILASLQLISPLMTRSLFRLKYNINFVYG